MQSTQQHTFSRVPTASIPRSRFNRTSGLKTTFDAGYIIPFYIDEVLPGDTHAVRANLFARLTTPFVPVMDNLFLDVFWFYVPNRLLWEHWNNFMGEQEDPDDLAVLDYQTPLVTTPAGGWQEASMGDYFGIPTKVPNLTVQAFAFRAYNLIWNEWFRDENLQSKVPVSKTDGPDDPINYPLLRRGKRHDYFTSALPWPQKGPGVEIPLGTSAPIVADGTFNLADNNNAIGAINGSLSALNPLSINPLSGTAAGAQNLHYAGGLQADLSQAASATINSLRQAFQIQKLYERDARGGTRYTEIIRSHFGVISPDSRLQRPEFLGGGTSRINIHPVPQTSGSGTYTDTPQGNLAALGTTSMDGNGFTKSFTEHGIIIGLLEVRADLTYQNGLDRMWSRRTRFDYYWPALAHIGEQAVLNKEIYAQGNLVVDQDGAVIDDKAFGYQERWAEYRYKPSRITGLFRSNATQSLDIWHLAQKFDNLPTLSSAFIEDQPDVKRISAIPSQPDFLMDAYIEANCTRPMPTYSVPGLIDHF